MTHTPSAQHCRDQIALLTDKANRYENELFQIRMGILDWERELREFSYRHNKETNNV